MECLLIVDVQNDFCKGGSLEVKNSENIIPKINKLIDKFNRKKSLVVSTLDWHPSNHGSFASNSRGSKIGEQGMLHGIPQIWWPDHCVQNSVGAQLHSGLYPIKNKIYKGDNHKVDSYSGFFNASQEKTDLHGFLKKNEITTLYIVGLSTDYCIKFTVLDALKLGYKVFLVEECCKGVNLNPNDSKNAILEMKSKGAIIL